MKKIKVITFFVLVIQIGFGQDVGFSQFYNNQLYFNPAMAGSTYGARVSGIYRNQWPSIPSKFVTYGASADIYNPALQGGLGIIAMQDVAGEGFLKTSSVGAVMSFDRPIPKVVRIRAGYTVAFVSKKIDWNKLTFPDQLDAVQGNIYSTKAIPAAASSKNFVDFSAGGALDFPKIKFNGGNVAFNVAYSASHITQPDESLQGSGKAKLPMKQTYFFSSTLTLGDPKNNANLSYVQPLFIYEIQNNFSTNIMGFTFSRDPFLGGLFYRKKKVALGKDNDAIITTLGVKFPLDKNTNARLGYSYDVTINKLANNTAGSHELTFVLEFKDVKLFSGKTSNTRKKNKQSKRITECADFNNNSILF